MSDAPHLGFDGREHRHRMGMRRVEPGAWLEPDRNEVPQLQLKQRLVAERPADVLCDAGTPEVRAAAVRLAELVADAQGRSVAEVVGGDDTSATAVLASLAGATQEDWCLMLREDTWRLRGACVCFPSRWVLAEKVGGTVAEIHDPVPRYEDQLGGLVEQAMDRLRAEQPVWRLNWNIWDDPRLFQPRADPEAEAWPLPRGAEVADRTFLRVERQTLRRIGEDAIAFSIRVHQRPLAALRHQPGALELLAATLDGMAASPSARKKLGRLYEPIDAWVRSELATR